MTENEPQESAVVVDDEPSRGVIDYFRDSPARFFGILGTIVFVAGWAGVIYIAFFSDSGAAASTPAYFRVQIMVSLGASVTIASAILWGIAAYIWIHLLPDMPD